MNQILRRKTLQIDRKGYSHTENGEIPLTRKIKSDVDTVSALKKFMGLRDTNSMFSNYSNEDFGVMAKAFNVIQVNKGDVMIKKGEIASFFCIILEGFFKVSMNDSTIVDISVGKIVGEMSMFTDGEVRNADIVASTTGILAVLSFTELNELCEFEPALAIKIIRTCACSSVRALKSMNEEIPSDLVQPEQSTETLFKNHAVDNEESISIIKKKQEDARSRAVLAKSNEESIRKLQRHVDVLQAKVESFAEERKSMELQLQHERNEFSLQIAKNKHQLITEKENAIIESNKIISKNMKESHEIEIQALHVWFNNECVLKVNEAVKLKELEISSLLNEKGFKTNSLPLMINNIFDSFSKVKSENLSCVEKIATLEESLKIKIASIEKLVTENNLLDDKVHSLEKHIKSITNNELETKFANVESSLLLSLQEVGKVRLELRNYQNDFKFMEKKCFQSESKCKVLHGLWILFSWIAIFRTKYWYFLHSKVNILINLLNRKCIYASSLEDALACARKEKIEEIDIFKLQYGSEKQEFIKRMELNSKLVKKSLQSEENAVKLYQESQSEIFNLNRTISEWKCKSALLLEENENLRNTFSASSNKSEPIPVLVVKDSNIRSNSKLEDQIINLTNALNEVTLKLSNSLKVTDQLNLKISNLENDIIVSNNRRHYLENLFGTLVHVENELAGSPVIGGRPLSPKLRPSSSSSYLNRSNLSLKKLSNTKPDLSILNNKLETAKSFKN